MKKQQMIKTVSVQSVKQFVMKYSAYQSSTSLQMISRTSNINDETIRLLFDKD
ncbi:hypothetical protein [Sporolactobacillus terrae]|uniref:hypothetical protein n=1 Tax=Sporolactobacillus terrae TaxID=269673 RepID=UPI0012DF7012|nr:hypothetical protein [Sporolactobacillus terrae]